MSAKRPMLTGRQAFLLVLGWIVACVIVAPAVLVFFFGDIPTQFGTSREPPTEGSIYGMTEQELSHFPWIKQMIEWWGLLQKYCSFGCEHCSCPYPQPPLRGVLQRDAMAGALHLQKFEHTSNGQDYYFDYFTYKGTYYSLWLGSPDLSSYLFYGALAAGAGSAVIGIIWSKRVSWYFIRK